VKLEIQRVIYFTTNMEAMSHFYREVMGLEPLPESGAGWKEFRAGGCNISLHGGKASATGRGPKVVFYTADVSSARDALVKRGAKMGKVASGNELTFCDGTDPDGNVFQISTRPT
jgi:predicted enzyme related to lactoylglutathione lyase